MAISGSIARIVLKHPYLNILIIAFLTLVFAFSMFHLKFDTSLSAFIIRNDPDMASYNKIKKIFETEETVFIAFKARDLFSKNDLEILQSLTAKIERLDHVRNVRSLTNANLIKTTPDSFEIKALVDGMPENPQESMEINKHVTTNYLYMRDLSSLDGKFGALLVNIENVPGKKITGEVVSAIKNVLHNEGEKTGLRFYLGGDAIINHSLGEYMKRDFFIFAIPTFIILGLLLLVTVGRLRDIVISLITMTLSLIWTLGSIVLLGKTLNNVTLGIIPLVLCISLEDIYYIHNHYYRALRSLGNTRSAFKDTLTHVIAPCFFTSFTTVVGFASLMANNIKPIIDFSIAGSIAVISAFAIAIILIPSVHLVLIAPAALDKKLKLKIYPGIFIGKILDFILKKRKLFWFVIPAVFMIALFGISKIRIETDHLSFFHRSSEVYKATTFIEKNLGGVSNLELTLTLQEEDGMKEPDALKEVDKLAQYLRKQKNVDKAMSITDFLKDMNRAWYDYNESYYRIPDTRNLVAQYLLLYSMSPRRNDVEKDFVDYPYRVARILCRMSEHNSTAILLLVNKIKSYMDSNVNPDLKTVITSYPVIYSNLLDSITRGQIKCLVFVFFALLIVTSIYFKSLKIGLLAMIPNTIPIVVTLGFMGFAGITLNVATAMTTGIAIGLAMDDTTHFFTRFKQRALSNPDYSKNIRETFRELGEPMMYSSFLMMAGYLVLAFSQFRLTVFFGFLCALTIFVALLCDLLITPWILMTFKPDFKQ